MATLLDVYVESFSLGYPSTSLQSALITLILKPGKLPTKRVSYSLDTMDACAAQMCKAKFFNVRTATLDRAVMFLMCQMRLLLHLEIQSFLQISCLYL